MSTGTAGSSRKLAEAEEVNLRKAFLCALLLLLLHCTETSSRVSRSPQALVPLAFLASSPVMFILNIFFVLNSPSGLT